MTDQDYVEIFRKLENSYNSLLEDTAKQLKEMISSFEVYKKEAEAVGLSVWSDSPHFPTKHYPFYSLQVMLSRTTKYL